MFQKARTLKKRLKLFLWGDSGSGKTTFALKFPRPVMIDLEGGADQYGDDFDFDVLRTADVEEAEKAVRWLASEKHDFATLIIDPITVFWDSLQKKWSEIFLKRKVDKKGWKHEFYEFQVKDWMTIKAEFKAFVSLITSLDMNVVCTARSKVQYEDGGSMKVSGETFDGEKNLPYVFDTVIQLFKDQRGAYKGYVTKDRTNRLNMGEVEVSYETFEKLFGKEDLERKATPVLVSEEQLSDLRDFFTLISSEDQEKTLKFYRVEFLEDLSKEQADELLSKLKKKFGGAFEDKSEKASGKKGK